MRSMYLEVDGMDKILINKSTLNIANQILFSIWEQERTKLNKNQRFALIECLKLIEALEENSNG